MKDALIAYGVPAALFFGIMLFKRLGQVTSARAHELVAGGGKLIDVRSPPEFSTGHLPGAVNIPLHEIGSERAALGPKDSAIILYCASGTRSAMARTVLKRKGFTQVFNLGSMGRW